MIDPDEEFYPVSPEQGADAMTDQERQALADVVYALRRLEWGGLAGQRCPNCGRSRAYHHHVCSCPTAIAIKKLIALGVPVPMATVDTVPPSPGKGPFSLHEITLEDWCRYQWREMTAAGDRSRVFSRGKERTPEEIAKALEQLQDIREQMPGLFANGSAHP